MVLQLPKFRIQVHVLEYFPSTKESDSTVVQNSTNITVRENKWCRVGGLAAEYVRKPSPWPVKTVCNRNAGGMRGRRAVWCRVSPDALAAAVTVASLYTPGRQLVTDVEQDYRTVRGLKNV